MYLLLGLSYFVVKIVALFKKIVILLLYLLKIY